MLRASVSGVLGAGVVAGANTVSADSGSVTATGPYGGRVTARQHDHRDTTGGVLENIGAIDESLRIADLHTFVWDDGEQNTANLRDDGRNVTVERATDSPEVVIDGWAQIDAFGGRSLYGGTYYVGDVEQRALVVRDRPAVLIDTEISFFWPDEDIYGDDYETAFGDNERTIYTLWNPVLGDGDNEAWVTDRDGYDLVVARDGQWHVAVGHCAGDQRTFDGRRIGRTDGTEKSAWEDVYGEDENDHPDWRDRNGDGWLDSNESNDGPIDVAFGNYIGTADAAGWQVALGFGTTEAAAATNAVTTLERGYETERNQY